MRDRFYVDTDAAQEWQNGYRVQSGGTWQGFSVSGSTTVTVTKNSYYGIADAWPQRGDCWTGGGGAANSYNCPTPGPHPSTAIGNGGVGTQGTDQWSWTQNRNYYKTPGGYNSYLSESVFDVAYNGGNQWVYRTGENGCCEYNYYASPSSAYNGQRGIWISMQPGSSRSTSTGNTVAVARAASFDVGAATGGVAVGGHYESTQTETRTTKITQTHEALTGHEAPWMGWMFQYDMDGTRRWDHWTCQWPLVGPVGPCVGIWAVDEAGVPSRRRGSSSCPDGGLRR